MEKPITVQIIELNQKIAQALNESNLHPYIKKNLLEEFCDNMQNILAHCVEQEKIAYQKSLESEDNE